MTARTYQPAPGDLALVRNEHDVWNVAICTLRSDRPGFWWRYGVSVSYSPMSAEARPLVVIDPSDRAEVERLRDLMDAAYAKQNGDDYVDTGFQKGARGNALQAALREYANPTPPKCSAALIFKGERFACDQTEGHAMTHSNIAAGAIWGEGE